MNRWLVIDKEKHIHNKGLGERISMTSNAKSLQHPTTGYKLYSFKTAQERKNVK